MRRDIDFAGEAGATGIVLGMLMPDGSIDIDRTAYLIEYASPMPVTFHRAFDRSRDPMRSLSDIISTGAVRILTSGQRHSALDGIDLITRLVKNAGNKISIMPGAGVNEHNIAEIVMKTGVSEIHLTGSIPVKSGMKYQKAGIGISKQEEAQPEFIRNITDSRIIARIKDILK
jgi:copper homeostasis protein